MIAIDIGNTNLNFALIQNDKIKTTFRLKTTSVNKKLIDKALEKYKKEDTVICSVVPSVTKLLKRVKPKIKIVGQDIQVPIKCRYDKKKVGQDRLVTAYAAKNIFPKTRMIIDFGTAITLDFISKKGAYQGGLILPGIGSTLRVLSNCALLPKKIKSFKPTPTIPKNTQSSVSKGINEGFSLMINSLVKKYKRKLHLKASERIVITGGEAGIITDKLDFSFKYKPFLVLEGLWMLHKNRPIFSSKKIQKNFKKILTSNTLTV